MEIWNETWSDNSSKFTEIFNKNGTQLSNLLTIHILFKLQRPYLTPWATSRSHREHTTCLDEYDFPILVKVELATTSRNRNIRHYIDQTSFSSNRANTIAFIGICGEFPKLERSEVFILFDFKHNAEKRWSPKNLITNQNCQSKHL